MNAKKVLSAIFAMSLMFAGCEKEEVLDDQKPFAKIDPVTLEFGAAESDSTVSVTCNRQWRFENVPDWVSLSVNGKNVADASQSASSKALQVKVSVTANAGRPRSVTINVNGGKMASAKLTVKQDGAIEYAKIADVRKLFDGKGSKDTVILDENTIVKAYVISSGRNHSNFPSSLDNMTSQKTIFIQDETAGLNLFCDDNNTAFDFGDEVEVDLSKAGLILNGSQLEIVKLPVSKLTLISPNNTIVPRKISVEDLFAKTYDSQYVSIDSIQVQESDLSKTWVVGGAHTSINVESSHMKTFVIFSGKNSAYGAEKVAQGSGTICGIATQYNNTIQLQFAQRSDYAGLTQARFVPERKKAESERIADLLDAGEDTEVTLKNVLVVATGLTTADDPNGRDIFMVKDADGDHLFVYAAPLDCVEVGDKVNVKGIITNYAGCLQIAGGKMVDGVFTGGPTVEKTGTGEVVYPESPVDVTSRFDTYNPGKIEYVTFVGKLSISSGKYYNIIVDGATTVQGSLQQSKQYNLADYNNVPAVRYTGYYLYHNNNGKYLNLLVTNIEVGTEPYVELDKTSISVPATATDTTFRISSNTDWTCEAAGGATVNPESGNGNADITVSFEENKSTESVNTYTITVQAGSLTKTLTITQAKAIPDDVKMGALTNAEIIAGLTSLNSDKTTYTDVTFSSACGNWVTNVSALKTNTFLQIRNNKKAGVLSPVFEGNIIKVELDVNEKTVQRKLALLAPDYELPSTDDNYNKSGNTMLDDALGYVQCAKSVKQTVTVELNEDAKQFRLVTYDGAAYIDEIRVYYAPEE